MSRRLEISKVLEAACHHDLVMIGTIDARQPQADLVSAFVVSGTRTVAVALRTSYDLARYPTARTFVCTYGIHPPSIEALANALFGTASIDGVLPAAVSRLYSVGQGIDRAIAR